MILYTPGSYEHCPRGAGDEAAHGRKFLVHLEIDGVLHCIVDELHATLELQRLTELHAADERCEEIG